MLLSLDRPGGSSTSRRPRLRNSIILLLVGLGADACTLGTGISQLCEPQGLRLKEPAGGPEILHPVTAAPPLLDDGWPVSTLRAEGLDPAMIGVMLRTVKEGTFTQIDSILIARNGNLVLEAYFNGFDRDTPHNTRSAFKSVTSTLAGIAIDRGLVADVDVPISRYFPDYWPTIAGDLDRKYDVTLAHLLTMTSGFELGRDLDRAVDWYAYALNQPMVARPGAQYTYSDANSMLIGGLIAEAAGQPLPEFASDNLFAPMGFTNYCWTLTPAGQPMTDGSFYVRPRDLLKLGQLYSDLGLWNGQRIVSERWVTESTKAHVIPAQSVAGPVTLAYGYHWRTRVLRPGDSPVSYYFAATGGGGQLLFVFPRLDLVIVFTGGHYGTLIGERQHSALLNDYIAPAIMR